MNSGDRFGGSGAKRPGRASPTLFQTSTIRPDPARPGQMPALHHFERTDTIL